MHKITTAVIEMEKKKMEKDVNKLQAVRKAAGMTQQQLAEKSGVSYSLICKFESGEKNIKKAGLAAIVNLCDALGCQPQDIVTDPAVERWAEETTPAMKALQMAFIKGEAERLQEDTAKRIKRTQDERNGIKPEPKPMVKRTTEKVKKTITMEVEFPADFMPPDKFDFAGRDNNWHSKCDDCPFYVFTDENGNWCQHPECGEDDSCPLKKYFKKATIEPIVSEEEYQAVQEKLKERKK